MKTKRLYYKTAYDTNNTICGYVNAIDKGDDYAYYIITIDQYRRALRNRTIGGDAALVFVDYTDDGWRRVNVRIIDTKTGVYLD